MHTFSPAKMWINGLKTLSKPFLHLHTQFNRDLPWGEIDMDFMNINQAAHGDREFGFMCTRMRLNRKVVVGHWKDAEAQERIGAWSRAAVAWADWQGGKVARFGDNMRYVAVTEGDKVAAESTFGFSINGYGVGDLVARIKNVSPKQVDALVARLEKQYEVVPALKKGGRKHNSLRYEAQVELGLRAFLEEGGFFAYTDTFEDLHGLKQLPGMASQRLMGSGYGFGAEGDWKHAALVRAMKVMGHGLAGGTSFMEDYTYHLHPDGHKVLGSHMLEICESIAAGKPSLEIHPLGIGGKADPVRLVFDTATGPGLNASVVDLGNRFRLLVNEVEVVAPEAPMPKLPVARTVWSPKPDFKTGCGAWIHAGGAHHTGFSMAVTTEMMEDFANIAGVEFALIDGKTTIREFRKDLQMSEVYYHIANGFSFA
jgi:L-arabinose isomerase